MAKKSSKMDLQKTTAKIVNHAKKHLMTDVAIPAGAILLILVLVVLRFPYQAEVRDIVEEEYEVEIVEQIPDTLNPIEERTCVETAARSRIENHLNFMDEYGLHDYKCKAEFRVWNNEETTGEWTFRYVFDVSGKEVVTEDKTLEIPRISSQWFYFESDECQEGDVLSGTYEMVSYPTTRMCEYHTIIPNKTVIRTETRTREVLKTTIETRSEPLWQKLIGYNRFEKV